MKQTKQDKITIENTLVHFPNDISKEINDFVINEVLYYSRYLFVTTENNKRIAFCTHCKKNQQADGLKHKEKKHCIHCKSKCKVQVAGYSRKYMVDRAYFTYYEKSKIDKEAVIARGFTVWMDFSGDYEDVIPKFKTDARYLFDMGDPVFIKTGYSWPDNSEFYELRKSVFSLFQHYYFMGIPSERNQKVSIESINKAIKGTQFQYSEWDKYSQEYLDDYVTYFALYAKHPQIEYLTKLGFRDFVRNKLFKETTYRTINWNGKTIDKVLKTSKQGVRELVNHKRPIDPFTLAVYQLGQKDGSNFTIEEAAEIRYFELEAEFERIKEMLKNIRFRRLINYLKRQVKRSEMLAMEHEERTEEILVDNYTNVREQLILLHDYWEGCKELGLRIGKDIADFPSDLQLAHDNVFKQITFKENEELDNKIKGRLKKLINYEYENEKYIIKPFKSTYEIIQEGKELKHCVGSYSERYAKGKTDLFTIREKSRPDKPFYTLELKDGKVRQCYGYGNKKGNKEVNEFVREFEEKVLNNKKEMAS